MCVLTDLATTLQTLLTTEAEQAARDTGCVRRVRQLSGATLVQTLVLGWLHDPHASLDDLADFAADLGAHFSPQALDQRLTPAATRCLAAVLTTARWQIELLLKLWKSHGGLESSRGERAERVRCEVYAKRIGQVVQQWVLVTCGGPCVADSYPKAARRVRRQALVLAVVLLDGAAAVVRVLERLRQRLQQRCRVQRRGRRPSTYELLLDPDRVSAPDDPPPAEEIGLHAA